MLTGHDIGALYRLLNGAGVPQRRIAALTGTTQPQVADIITGRRARVQVYDVLVRTAEGLGIPRERMGLSFWGPDGKWYGPEGIYPEEATVADPSEGGDDEMYRRAVLLAAPVALWGHSLFGEVPKLPVPDGGEALPSRLETIHVAAVADLLVRLRGLALAYGGQAEVVGAAADRSARLLTVPGDDAVRARLGSVLAEFHSEAGWTYFDSGADDAAQYYFCRALDIARWAGDRYQVAYTLRRAGMLPLERGRLDDSLKLFQFGQITFLPLDRATKNEDPRVPSLTACLDSLQARALARMQLPDQARSKLAAAQDGWQAPAAFAQADADYRSAEVSLCLGQLDVAERFAALSVQGWGDQDRRPAASARILLATIHVRAGEPNGLALAHNAISAATKLSSFRVRKRLEPLATALDSRSGSDAKDLAQMARQIAATQA